jgi:hypothetical protein
VSLAISNLQLATEVAMTMLSMGFIHGFDHAFIMEKEI